ncbi:MAG: SufD family Fe-S cluster assembly protein [Micrococcales bacterium]|nr:SufD family Fe-S cluster assembly protein [Micrococcales bacterium]
MAKSRATRLASFDLAAFPVPTGSEEEWRFTPVSRLAPLLEGPLDGSVSVLLPDAGPDLEVLSVTKPSPLVGVAPPPDDRAAVLAWTQSPQADLVTIKAGPKGQVFGITLKAESGTASHHLVVRLEAGVSAGIVLEVIGGGSLSQTVEVQLDEAAELEMVTVQNLQRQSLHHAAQRVVVAANAKFKHMAAAVGGAVSRTTQQIALQGQSGQAELAGINLTGLDQHHEVQLFIDHAAPGCRSRATYKGALLAKTARSVWVGDVLIRQAAHGTDSYEINRNLVLAKGARAHSVPNLEIETGQITGAGHASATGPFDDQQMFYLMSRGIGRAEARSMLVQAFFEELISQVGIEAARELLSQLAAAKLAQNAGLGLVEKGAGQ